MRVLFLSAEAAPYTKVGGLGDVAGWLPQALSALPGGPDVTLVTPLHGGARARASELSDLGPLRLRLADGTSLEGRALVTETRGVRTWFIAGGPIDEDFPVYHADAWRDGVRFGFFSMAALELARSQGWPPDVVHANDWHTAPAILHCHTAALPAGAARPRTVFTIHNLPFMGHGTQGALAMLGLLPPLERVAQLPDELRYLPLPLAVVLADRLTTVSRGYAREILTQEYGCGLQGTLRARLERDPRALRGIVNGLDTRLWDPATDAELRARFEISSRTSRADNKAALQAELGLPLDPLVPLVALVSRLTHQKGIDLVPRVLGELARREPFQLVMLGSGDPKVEEQLQILAGHLVGRAALRVGYDEALSRRIFAGADLLTIPSRYEPCGLTQLIAMRYGCVPIARETGGLADTVRDFDLHDDPNGFVFPAPSFEAFSFGVRRARHLRASCTLRAAPARRNG